MKPDSDEMLAQTKTYDHWPLHAQPPDGWHPFGIHAGDEVVPPLEFSMEEGEDGLPLWERVVE